MNLYQIHVGHYGPKDSHHSIQGYILADSDEKVYDLCAELGFWYHDEDDMYEDWDVEKDAPLKIPYKDHIIENKGNICLVDELSDFHYGHTLYDWELIYEMLNEVQEDMLNRLNIKILN